MIIRRFFAGLFLVLFMMVSLPLFLLWGGYGIFGDENFYIRDEFVDSSYDLLIDVISKNGDLKEKYSLNEEEIAEIARKIIVKEDLIVFIEDFVEEIKTLEIKEDGTAELAISLGFLKEKRERISKDIAVLLYGKLPLCEGDVLTEFNSIECVPEGISEENFISTGAEIISETLEEAFPEVISYNLEIPETVRTSSFVEFFDDIVGWMMWGSISFLLICLIAIGILIFRPWKKVLQWEGATIFFASLNILIVLLALIFSGNILDIGEISAELALTPAQVELYQRMYNVVIGAYATKLIILLVPLMILSLMAWVMGIILSKKDKKLNDTS